MRNLEQTEVHQDLGTRIEAGNAMRPQISEYIRKHPEREEVSEPADPEFGWIAPVDDAARERLRLPASTAAVVEWNDAADCEPRVELRALTAAEHDSIVGQATSTLVERVLAHYDAHPGDDGHPAFALYAEWRHRKDRAAELAAAGNIRRVVATEEQQRDHGGSGNR